MSAYHIWNPWLDSDGKLVFVVTTADSDQIAKGTSEFVAGLLADLGIKEKASKWTLEFCRAQYFSEYLDSKNWKDRWQPVWRLTVSFAKPLSAAPKKKAYYETNATDDSWTPKDYHGSKPSAHCLIVADFKKEADGTAVLKAVAKAKGVDGHMGKTGKLFQVHIDLGEQKVSFFEKGDDAKLKQVLSLCEEHNGLMHYTAAEKA